MGLEDLISNDLFYFSVYFLSLGMISATGAMFVHIIDLKTRDYQVYQFPNEGNKHYEKRLGKFVY